MPVARVGEIELSYERAGDGPPLLAIMGMSGTFDHWNDAFLDDLRRELDVIVYDHRGVGSSSRLNGGEPLTIAEMAQDAAGLLDALGIDRAHVLGISMGGMVAQELALAHPERVHSLTLGCTYCGGEDSALSHERTLRKLMEAAASGDRTIAVRAAWETNVSPAFAADEQQYERFLEIGLRRAVAMDVVMAQMRAIAGHDTSPRLPGLRAPTLVIHGTLDEMLPVQNGHQIAGLIPGSRLEVLDGAGHLFFWEQPERSAELIRAHAAVHA
jgi:pimeloyl-ACP methyl ester carboxylesterase